MFSHFINCFLLLTQFQIGEYFGAVVCAMDVDRDAYTDLVLISAPMYMDSDREGRVYVCSLSNVVNDSFIQNILDFSENSNIDTPFFLFPPES